MFAWFGRECLGILYLFAVGDILLGLFLVIFLNCGEGFKGSTSGI